MTAKRILRIGTRGSVLAVAQAAGIKKSLESKNRALSFKLVRIQTTGDEFQSVELFKKNKIGVFTKEIEKKLLSGEIDIAVHSLKDLPTDLPEGLVLAAFPKRLDPRDALISRKGFNLKTLPFGASVGTGSPRRRRQALLVTTDLDVRDLRGNLDTRIGKVLKTRELDAVLVARAGLLRIKKYLRFSRPIEPDQILPAVGQAALGIEVRSDDASTILAVTKLNHIPTMKIVLAERNFLKTLHGGCRVPVGISSKLSGGKIHLKAVVFSVKHSRYLSDQISMPAARSESAGARLAEKLLKKGAGELLREARS